MLAIFVGHFEALGNEGTLKTNERSQRKESVNKRPSWLKTCAQEIFTATKLVAAWAELFEARLALIQVNYHDNLWVLFAVNPGLVLIGLRTTRPLSVVLCKKACKEYILQIFLPY